MSAAHVRLVAITLLVCLATMLTACAGTAPVPAAKPAATQDPALARLFDDYLEAWLPLNPLSASRLGDHRYDDRFANTVSSEWRAQMRALCSSYLTAARRVDAESLVPADRLSLDIFRWELEIRLALLDNDDYRRPVHQLGSVPISFPLLGSGGNVHPFRTVRDYDNFLKRIDGFHAWMDTAIANMRDGARVGVTQPRIVMETTLPQLAALIVSDETQSLFWQPIAKLPADMPAGDKARLTAAYAKAIRETIVPSYRRLHDFIRDEYLPRCRTSVGLLALPDGPAQYARLVRLYTTTDRTPAQIHEYGKTLVARVQGEMDAIRREVGFAGDLKAFNASIRADPRTTPFNTEDEVLAEFRRIRSVIEPNLPKLFGTLPKSDFEIRETEKFRTASASAQYMAGSPDGSRKGVFYVPIPDPRRFSTIDMENLVVHEVLPGHHFQVSLAQELNLPRFRRHIYYSAYGEGWAVYAETLGSQLGVYRDPYHRFGRLVGELRGATSLVVDTGLHALGWSREQALQYFLDNAIGSEDLAENRVLRYIATPGQTLSYLIGEAKMHELRARAERKLGSRFDIRAFHDQVLKDGAMPLAVLEAKMDAWLASQ